jgi:hypothetical protein
MYSDCVYCESPLGRNDALQTLPVGRRIAFDSALGRLWVVCPRCARWSLVSIDERWEPIEEAERRFRSTRVRVSTAEIGLARLTEGLELVRIGRPLRPEFAAWRYGDQLGRRRRRAMLAGAGVLGVGGVVAGAGLVTGAISLAVLAQAAVAYNSWHTLRTVIRIPVGDEIIRLKRPQLGEARVLPDAETGTGWRIDLIASHPRRRRYSFAGADAERIATLLLPWLNPTGAGARAVIRSVAELEGAGGPRQYLNRVIRHPPKLRWDVLDSRPADGLPIAGLPGGARLAFEMALHEEHERRVLDGELAGLEHAWRAADEIAAIADELLIPEAIRERLSAPVQPEA